MGSTTPYGLRYPEYAQGADPKLAVQNLAEDIAPRLHRAEPLTGAQIAAIAVPRIGQLVLNTDSGRVQFWNGTAWRAVGGGASGTATISATPITANVPLTFSAFIGVGFEEVSFSIGGWFAALAVGSAANLVSNTGTAVASTTEIAAQVSFVTDSVGTVTANISNVRMASDGYLRFDFTAQYAGTTPARRMNWRAR